MRDTLTFDPEQVAEAQWLDALRAYITRARDAGEVVDVQSRPHTLTPADVAKRLGMSRSTISRKIKNGEIAATRVGSHHRIALREFERFRDEQVARRGADADDGLPQQDRVADIDDQTLLDIGRTDYRRRLLYHARLAAHLPSLDWGHVAENLNRVEASIQGDLAHAAVDRWRTLIVARDLRGIEQVFGEHSQLADLMRTISPFAGVLSEPERLAVIAEVRRTSGVASTR